MYFLDMTSLKEAYCLSENMTGLLTREILLATSICGCSRSHLVIRVLGPIDHKRSLEPTALERCVIGKKAEMEYLTIILIVAALIVNVNNSTFFWVILSPLSIKWKVKPCHFDVKVFLHKRKVLSRLNLLSLSLSCQTMTDVVVTGCLWHESNKQS